MEAAVTGVERWQGPHATWFGTSDGLEQTRTRTRTHTRTTPQAKLNKLIKREKESVCGWREEAQDKETGGVRLMCCWSSTQIAGISGEARLALAALCWGGLQLADCQKSTLVLSSTGGQPASEEALALQRGHSTGPGREKERSMRSLTPYAAASQYGALCSSAFSARFLRELERSGKASRVENFVSFGVLTGLRYRLDLFFWRGSACRLRGWIALLTSTVPG